MATTRQKLIAAAAALLDRGGQEAVTLRAIADRVGVSHNAPYRHFRDRSALLAAVAERDFIDLRAAFDAAMAGTDASSALRVAACAFVDYAFAHPARYRLLFSDPGLPADESLKAAASASFESFGRLVARCQSDNVLPGSDAVPLTGLIYAALHGAIDLQLGGRASDAKGLASVTAVFDLLIQLIAARSGSSSSFSRSP